MYDSLYKKSKQVEFGPITDRQFTRMQYTTPIALLRKQR